MIDIHNKDCFAALQSMPDNSIDFICIDPPYTDGKGHDVLAGHKIQTKIDIYGLAKELFRVAKPNTFYAFFGQMPTIVEWYQAAVSAGFTWQEHILWAKRMKTSPYLPIQRTHESIYILQKGNPKYHKTNARYEDLKTPALQLGLYELSTIKTTISDLQRRLLDRKYDDLYFSKVPTSSSPANDIVHNIKKRNIVIEKKDDLDFYCEENNLPKPERDYTKNVKIKNPKSNDTFNNYQEGFKYRSKNQNNITNLWSFLPHNQTKFKDDNFNIKHPTVKPIPLLERLIELCTPEDKEIVVLDSFLGSGTTALACQNTNRNFIGFELDKEYYEICVNRIEKNRKRLEIKRNVLL